MARIARFALAALLPFAAIAQERFAPGQERDPGQNLSNREGNSGNIDERGYPRRPYLPDDYLTLPAGTPISVRTNESINTQERDESRTYSAQVSQDVIDADGRVAIPRGSDARLIVRQVGHDLMLDLQSVSVAGRRYLVDSNDIEQQSRREGVGANKRTAEFGGGGAVLGTLLGAIAGGGKGAAIGALAGGAAGIGTEVLTRGSAVRVPAETVLSFRLDSVMSLRPVRP
ncbi:MAG TPA: hypothetical protein VKB79_06240 [Bryobacteraceae bacterium]|nr:hypothetical protein [Bryobacteraceae bacterium]